MWIISVIAAVLAVFLVTFFAAPRKFRGRPAKFAGRITGRRLVVCAGDSLTAGTISGNYVAQLEKQFAGRQFVNAGVNGDTSADLLARVGELLACNPDEVTILIGTNDVLKSVDLDAYRRNLGLILCSLGNRPAAILSLPPLGEVLSSEENHRVMQWNEVIRAVAAQHSATYLPLFETISRELTKPAKPFKLSVWLMFKSSFRHNVLRRSFDEIAAANGFTMLTDQVHLSNHGADAIVELIASWLSASPCNTFALSQG